jgi:hypothetical protein
MKGKTKKHAGKAIGDNRLKTKGKAGEVTGKLKLKEEKAKDPAKRLPVFPRLSRGFDLEHDERPVPHSERHRPLFLIPEYILFSSSALQLSGALLDHSRRYSSHYRVRRKNRDPLDDRHHRRSGRRDPGRARDGRPRGRRPPALLLSMAPGTAPARLGLVRGRPLPAAAGPRTWKSPGRCGCFSQRAADRGPRVRRRPARRDLPPGGRRHGLGGEFHRGLPADDRDPRLEPAALPAMADRDAVPASAPRRRLARHRTRNQCRRHRSP